MVKKMPERFKRSRSKGAKLPDGVICVTRPGRWGNPYPTREQFWIALRSIIKGNKFPRELIEHYDHMKRIADSYHELTGQDLACWCSLDSECHADDLLRVANDNCWLAFSKKHLSTEPASAEGQNMSASEGKQ